MKQIYNVGIYCRLSVDDASNAAKARSYIPADESTSIEGNGTSAGGYVPDSDLDEVRQRVLVAIGNYYIT